jgi:2-haloacid dehalogenase
MRQSCQSRVVDWVVFDLNGTLLDVAAVGDDLLHEALFAAMTLNHVGEYRPLPELLAAAAARRHEALGGPPVAEVKAAAAAMPAYSEAPAALDRLAAAGRRLAVLTNSPTERAEAGLRSAGLRERFEHVVGTDQVGAFKPDARVYRHGLAVLGAAADEATMVAAHWWDLRGARAVGMRVAWVGRGEGALSSLLPDPDAQGADLLEVAEAIVAAS